MPKHAISAAETFLTEANYPFDRLPDGRLRVRGSIDLGDHHLSVLPDLSNVVVEGNFYCHGNGLTSLKGAPAEVLGGFWCNNNALETLEFTPRGIVGQFVCSNNRLTTLAFAPEAIEGDFVCTHNKLSSLEGAPRRFCNLMSDFGAFKSLNDVPDHIRYSPAMREARAKAALTLSADMRVSRPLSFRK